MGVEPYDSGQRDTDPYKITQAIHEVFRRTSASRKEEVLSLKHYYDQPSDRQQDAQTERTLYPTGSQHAPSTRYEFYPIVSGTRLENQDFLESRRTYSDFSPD